MRIYLEAEEGDEKQNYFHFFLLEILQNIRKLSKGSAYIKTEQRNAFKLYRNFSFTQIHSSLSILNSSSHSHFNSLSTILVSFKTEHCQEQEVSSECNRVASENLG